MKRFMTVFLIFILICSMSGCGALKSALTGSVSTSDDIEDSDTYYDDDFDDDYDDDYDYDGEGNLSMPEFEISEPPAKKLMANLVEYKDANGCFSANIPEGWAVSTAGFDMMYWIRIYDPANPDLQVFTLLKTETLLMDQNSKKFYERYRDYDLYRVFADMIVVEKVEDFYSQFNEFCAFMTAYEPTYNGFNYPQISNFEVLERNDYGSFLSSVAIDDALLHATFEDTATGQKGEGMFTGTLCKGFVANGVGCNMMYNINAATAPYGEFAEYEELLTQIFGSIHYTDEFVATVLKDTQIKAAGSAQINQTVTETTNIIVQGWESRQKNYDITSAKYADSILGFERVYNVETDEVYRVYLGFMEIPGIGDFYQPITEDMYSNPVSGYVYQ